MDENVCGSGFWNHSGFLQVLMRRPPGDFFRANRDLLKITIVAGLGLILLGVIELVSTLNVRPCTGFACPSPNPVYSCIAIVMVIVGFVTLFFSRVEKPFLES